jgi:hypothetical protein
MIFNSPALKGGAIDMRDNQGFSHIVKICGTFLDRIQLLVLVSEKVKMATYYY